MNNVEKIKKIRSLREDYHILRTQLFDRRIDYQYLNLKISSTHPDNEEIIALETLHLEIITLVGMLEPLLEQLSQLQTRYCVIYNESFNGSISEDIIAIKYFAGDIDGELIRNDIDRSSPDYQAVYHDLQEFAKDLPPYVLIRSVKKC